MLSNTALGVHYRNLKSRETLILAMCQKGQERLGSFIFNFFDVLGFRIL